MFLYNAFKTHLTRNGEKQNIYRNSSVEQSNCNTKRGRRCEGMTIFGHSVSNFALTIPTMQLYPFLVFSYGKYDVRMDILT